MRSSKYTKELLEPIVKQSLSVADVCRTLKISVFGASNTFLSKRIKALGISTEHFLGQAKNSGPNHKGGLKKRTTKQILVLRELGSWKEKHNTLKRALLESGVKYKCACGNTGFWNKKTLVLAVDHINGNTMDNRKENLRFICPNCHSQTDNYGAKNKASLAK